jgi:hypothetical protein
MEAQGEPEGDAFRPGGQGSYVLSVSKEGDDRARLYENNQTTGLMLISYCLCGVLSDVQVSGWLC